jgi:hypothetical protein
MAASGHLEWCQTIVGRLIRIQFSPGSFRRKFTALDLDLLMAVIAVCLAPAVHPIAADIIQFALFAGFVNPAYTSQTCSECGYCDSRNRESQADFECKQCHMSMNADLNAARNILKRGLNHLLGLDEAEHARTEPDAQPAYRGKDASAMTCETSTR